MSLSNSKTLQERRNSICFTSHAPLMLMRTNGDIINFNCGLSILRCDLKIGRIVEAKWTTFSIDLRMFYGGRVDGARAECEWGEGGNPQRSPCRSSASSVGAAAARSGSSMLCDCSQCNLQFGKEIFIGWRKFHANGIF